MAHELASKTIGDRTTMSIRNSTLDIPAPQEKRMKPPTPTTSNEPENCYTEPILPHLVTGVNLG